MWGNTVCGIFSRCNSFHAREVFLTMFPAMCLLTSPYTPSRLIFHSFVFLCIINAEYVKLLPVDSVN